MSSRLRKYLSVFALLWIAGILAAGVHAQAPSSMSKEEKEALLKEASELGLIPPGMDVDASKLKDLLNARRKLSDSSSPPTLGVTTIAPRAPLPPQPTSNVEKSLMGNLPNGVTRDLKQFGYDLFGAPSTTFAPTDTVTVPGDYQLAPGDELNIYIWGKVLENTYTIVVDREGKIMLPKVGPLALAGVPFSKVPDLIKAKLGEVYQNFEVTVSLGKLHTISVVILGEVVKPGTYVVSPFATMFNVLYEAGGPTKNGSMRQIKLSRGDQVAGVADLYKFLTQGDRSQDFKLSNNDVIFVPPIGSVAGVSGHTKRSAIFELAAETNAKDLLNLAGGFLPGYPQRIQVDRFKGSAGRAIEEIQYANAQERDQKLAAFKISDGDLLMVYPPSNRRTNYLTVNGLVLHPGEYEYRPKMTLKDLIEKAGGITPTAFLKRVEVTRVFNERPGDTVRVDLKQIMDGDPKSNIELNEFDHINVYDYEFISVSGMVWNPDKYQWTQGMTVKDALEKAGGAKPGVWLVELKRVFNKRYTEKDVRLDIREILAGNAKANIELMEFDEIRVVSYEYVTTTGMVWSPDKYQWSPGMTVKDALEKAGGVKPGAWMKRGEIIRRHLPDSGELSASTEGGQATPQPNPAPLNPVQAAAPAQPVPPQPAVAGQPALVPAIPGQPPPAVPAEQPVQTQSPAPPALERIFEIIPFDVTAVLAGDKEADKLLQEYDVIKIYDESDILPRGYVSIDGAVYKPGNFALTPKMKLTDLFFHAGGLKKHALLQNVEIYRTEVGEQPKLLILNIQSLIEGHDTANDITLEDADSVYVRRNVDLDKRVRIHLSGEIRYPGEYLAEPGERLSSILKRAGGYTEKAYLPAAFYKRITVQESQKANIQRFIQTQREALLHDESTKPQEDTESQQKLRLASLDFRRQLIELVGNIQVPGRIVIKLDDIQKLHGGRDDVMIEDGDDLFIPATPASVQVIGSVYNPTALIYEKGKNLDYYLAKVGGPTREADKSQIYVIKASGEVTQKFARVQLIERGDTIIVPTDTRVRADWRQLLLDVSKIIANFAIGAAVATR